MNKTKTRNLSPAEYLDILMTEYFCCLLKQKIHKNKKNISYYEKVASYKIETINDLCERKLMPNPIEHNEILESKTKSFQKRFGIKHLSLSELEKILYFSPNNDFVVYVKATELIVKLIDYELNSDVITVKDSEGKIFDVDISDVRRIF
jgi:hypothetical protein